MTVAVDDVANRLLRKTGIELGLQPAREVQVDRVAEDDPGRRDEEDGVPVAIVRAIHVRRHLNDFAHRRAWRLRRPRRLWRLRRDGSRQPWHKERQAKSAADHRSSSDPGHRREYALREEGD